MTTSTCKHLTLKKLTDSLNINYEENGAWCPSDLAVLQFLRENEHELKASVVVLYKVKIVPDSKICKFGDWEERPYEMFVLARLSHKNGYDALLVNTEEGSFSLGWINEDG